MIRTTLLLALTPLAACTTVPPESTPPSAGREDRQCDPGPGRALVGQIANSETGARALALTGAERLRWGPPRSVFTMDYSLMRVNVMYDDAMSITEITCG